MKEQIKQIYHGSKAFVKQHARTILTVTSVIGVGATAYETGRAAIKIKAKLDNYKIDTGDNAPDTKTVIKMVWKDCIPPIATFAATSGLIIVNDRMNASREKAYLALATMASKKANDIVDATMENTTKKKFEEIKEAVTKKHVEENDMDVHGVYETGYGDTIFLDRSTGRYFKSDMQEVRRAINDMVEMMNDGDGRICLNDWYDALNIPQTDIGSHIGYCRTIDGRFDNEIVGMEPVIDSKDRVVTEIYFCIDPKALWYSGRDY